MCCCCVNVISHQTNRHEGGVSGTGPRSESRPEDVTAAPRPLGLHETDKLGVNTKGTAEETMVGRAAVAAAGGAGFLSTPASVF